MCIMRKKLILVLLSAIYIHLVQPECSIESFGIYCKNLPKTNDSDIIFPQPKETISTHGIKAAYLRNCSGNVIHEMFLLFPNLESLDIQFSGIDKFSPNANALNTLYIMNNSKFPNLTQGLLKECCKHLKILFIANNSGLGIEEGALKHLENLTHLTISKQNITYLTKDFFSSLKTITYLNLKHNGIEKIDENAFEDLSDLNHLVLSNNDFTNMKPKTFENLRILETLELYSLNFSNFNLSIFSKQRELKHLGIPTPLVKKKINLEELTKIFPKLESIGLQSQDQEDMDIAEFIKKCKISGFYIRFSSIYDLK